MFYHLVLVMFCSYNCLLFDRIATCPDFPSFETTDWQEYGIIVREDMIDRSGLLGCDHTLFLADSLIMPGFYQVSDQIIATASIPEGSVTLRAGVEVILTDDFTVEVGATLEVEMGPCILEVP
jgi:hypothetical protein